MSDIVHEMTLYAKRDPEPYVRWAGKVVELKQRIRELESWIFQAYKEGYQDAQNDESEGFDDDWMVSMAKMVFDEKLEPPQPFRPNPQCQSPDNCRSAGFCDDAWRCSGYPEPEQTQ